MQEDKIIGNEIVSLMGFSESDDRMLDLFEKLGVDKNEFDRDEDDGSFRIDLEDEKGLILSFDSSTPIEIKNSKYIGGQYLACIFFYYDFELLPYGLQELDSLEIIENKIGKKANYINKENKEKLYWMYKDLMWFTIIFEDETYSEINTIQINYYSNPEDSEMLEIMEPFKR